MSHGPTHDGGIQSQIWLRRRKRQKSIGNGTIEELQTEIEDKQEAGLVFDRCHVNCDATTLVSKRTLSNRRASEVCF